MEYMFWIVFIALVFVALLLSRNAVSTYNPKVDGAIDKAKKFKGRFQKWVKSIPPFPKD